MVDLLRGSIAAPFSACLAILGGCAAPVAAQQGETLESFGSVAQLRRFLTERRENTRSRQVEYAAEASTYAGLIDDTEVNEIVVSGSRIPSITNTQEAAVDEGGIVKMADVDTLVVLRRGRIFSIDLSGGGMRQVDVENAYPPDVSGSGDWYDEMLVADGWVVVVGYSYARGGTEINRFRIDDAGQMTFVDAYHLSSNDYYSSRNYASRLVGEELVFYTPLELTWDDDPLEALPRMRRWTGEEEARFEPIAGPEQIYVPGRFRHDSSSDLSTLHTVSRCDLTAPRMRCSAIGVLGPSSRNFYVSASAVYLWTNETAWGRRQGREPAGAMIYRMPLRRGAPQAIGVRGAPIDQFSFRENTRDRTLDVLVVSNGDGDGMWAPEVSHGDPALLRLPLARFGSGSRDAADALYRPLPGPDGSGHLSRNRWVGDTMVYGFSQYRSGDEAWQVVAAPAADRPATQLPLAYSLDRIEPVGADAMLVGSSDAGVTFTTLTLGGQPRFDAVYTMRNASEAEDRSHAFFYRPDPDSRDGSAGLMGLPVTVEADSRYSRLFYSSADMLFLRRDNGRLAPFGRLDSRPGSAADDACVASCADWYGNARPIFLGDRVFALLGYELVEGRSERGEIREVGRLDFAPVRSVRPVRK